MALLIADGERPAAQPESLQPAVSANARHASAGGGAPAQPGADIERAARLLARFETRFGGPARVYRAPGRINLIGEHTDYNEGFVLPTALALSCWIAGAKRADGRLVVRSDDLDEQFESDARSALAPSHRWSDYVIGVAAMLQAAGYPVEGATLLVSSDVPMGAGLSSSAALEVAAATALLDLADVAADPLDVAKICQRAENTFVGARCGIMDQFVATHARHSMALLVDCRSLVCRLLPVPSQVRIVACNTMVRHEVAGGAYNRRVSECQAGVERLAKDWPGVRSLRDVDKVQLEASRRDLPEVVFRRCRHVVTENSRTKRLADAFERSELAAIGPLMAESHRSLRDDYDVSCHELDVMVELAQAMPGVFGARMTGAGFGGCTVNLVHADAVAEFCRRMPIEYEQRTGRRPQIIVGGSGAAAGRVDVERGIQ